MSPRMLRSAAGVAASATLLLTAIAAGPSAAASQRACGWVVKPSPSKGSATLSAVAATSAQGRLGGRLLQRRRRVQDPDRALGRIAPGRSCRARIRPPGFHTTNALGAVVALSPKNAWAFGFFEKATTSFRTLIEHWDGKKWSVVPEPQQRRRRERPARRHRPEPQRHLGGRVPQRSRSPRTLTEHWNGAKWSIVTSPSVGAGDNFLFAVAGAADGLCGPSATTRCRSARRSRFAGTGRRGRSAGRQILATAIDSCLVSPCRRRATRSRSAATCPATRPGLWPSAGPVLAGRSCPPRARARTITRFRRSRRRAPLMPGPSAPGAPP